MTDSRLDLNNRTLCQLYETFQNQRSTIGEIYLGVPYHDFIDNKKYCGSAFPAITLASEHIITVTNIVNRFHYDLHSFISWSRVFEEISEDEKLMALVEFVIPVSNQCLSAPYLIKQTLIKSICILSHQANRFFIDNWTDESLKPDRKHDFNHAKTLARHFCTWPVIEDALAHLNSKEFIDASDDYRRKFNHGFPRRIEYGHSMIIERVEDAPCLPNLDLLNAPADMIAIFNMIAESCKNASWYGIRNAPPLYIRDLVPT
ncbi:MAG TPA: hypothetical protein VMS01_10365, partial [Stellaceae bacterium]|nr:hypothetical protein [Stellaceae bacterium]